MTINDAVKKALSDEVSEMVRGVGIENVRRVDLTNVHTARGSVYFADIEHEVHATATFAVDADGYMVVRLEIELKGPFRNGCENAWYFAIGRDAAKDRAIAMQKARAVLASFVR